MRICGIVAEYNPFHSGHIWHIRETRRRLGEESAIVCCMSGNWVQRGEAALLPKHQRARAALKSGADVVVELPTPYALLSAEGFAQSAVSVLLGLGVVTDLSFGAETGDIEALTAVAHTLLEHRTVQDTLAQLKTGISYAAARERALYTAIEAQAELIRQPNNILAVEYLKALIRNDSGVTPHAIPRLGAGHDSGEALGGTASASHIRASLRAGATVRDVASWMPESSSDILLESLENGTALVDLERLETAMLSALWRLNPEDLAALGDIAEGLEHRLHAAISEGRDLASIVRSARTRRYPEARIRRLLLRAFLGITAHETELPPPYARVLGMSDRGRQVLRAASAETTLPILTKPAHVRQLSPRARRLFEWESIRTDLWHLSLPAWREIPRGSEWRTPCAFENAENP